MDFSQYDGASEEFTALWSSLPVPPELPVNDFKRTVNENRETAAREEMKTLSPRILQKNHTITARDGHQIEARSYRPASTPPDQILPIYIHFHGGGFLFGTLASEDATCTRISLNTGVAVLNVNYRHTPEWHYPTPWHDAEDAFEWAFSHAQSAFQGDPSRIVIGGTSAGGTLSASLAQTKSREKSPSYNSLKGLVLMIPCTVHQDLYAQHVLPQMKSPQISSYVENEFAPILPLTRLRQFNDLLFPQGPPDASDHKASAGLATDEEVKNLPPTTFGIAGLDPLRDEALLYAQLLARNGVPTDVHVLKGVPHGSRGFGEKLAKASGQWDRVLYDGIGFALREHAERIGGEVKVNVWS